VEKKIKQDVATEEALYLPAALPPSPLRRRVNRKFIRVQEDATEKTTAEFADLGSTTDVFQAFFNKIRNNCLFCVVEKNEYHVHAGKQCPSMTAQQQGQWNYLKTQIEYPRPFPKPGRSPCYRCHIGSMGSNTLHGDFGSNCQNPNTMLTMAILIKHSVDRFQKARRAMEVKKDEWASLGRFKLWLTSPDAFFGTKSMKLLYWFIKAYAC
jgi:hypothetical protein